MKSAFCGDDGSYLEGISKATLCPLPLPRVAAQSLYFLHN
jgi:hypothetical protein